VGSVWLCSPFTAAKTIDPVSVYSTDFVGDILFCGLFSCQVFLPCGGSRCFHLMLYAFPDLILEQIELLDLALWLFCFLECLSAGGWVTGTYDLTLPYLRPYDM